MVVDHRGLGVRAHGAAAHLVGGEDRVLVGAPGRAIVAGDVGLGLDHDRIDVARAAVDRARGDGEAREDLVGRVEGLLQRLPDRIVDADATVPAEAHGAPLVAGQQPVDGDGDHRPDPGQLAHPAVVVGPEDQGTGRRQHGLQRRHLEEEADLVGAAIDELVRGDRLRRALVGVDLLLVEGGQGDHRVEEGAATDAAGVIEARPQKQRGPVDRAGAAHRDSGPHGHGPSGRPTVVTVEHATLDRGHAAPIGHEALGLRVGVEGQTCRHRLGDVGDVHRLLGVQGTTQAAVARVRTAVHVPADDVHVEVEGPGAVAEQGVVGVGVSRPGGDLQAGLDGLEVGAEVLDAEAFDPVHALPVLQDALGGAEAGGPVDRRAPADAAALEHADRLVGGRAAAAALVEHRVGVGLDEVEVGLGEGAALLEHHDPRALGGEPGRQHGAARAGADDADVAVDDDVGGDLAAVIDAPGHPGPPGVLVLPKFGGPG